MIENHEKLEIEAHTERLTKFFERRKKQMAHFTKWEKDRERLLEHNKSKHESKLGSAKTNANEALLEMERLGESIREKFKEHSQRMEEFK